jgi:putative Mg2+ transporter-C (MgtC) family protein
MHYPMDILIRELALEVPDVTWMVRATVRLLFAAVLAGVIGWQRERTHKTAGLRTHMLVALGSAIFTLVTLEADHNVGDVSRVIQGIAAGMGFIGGGVILKPTGEHQVFGLTTAATLWLVAAVGVAAGLGCLGSAIIGIVLTYGIVAGLEPVERRWHGTAATTEEPGPEKGTLTTDDR